jgi:class 3 adenylate cyclase
MTEDKPLGYVILDPGSPNEVTVPLVDRLFIGRECAGVDDSRRIVLGDDLVVSRNHLEIRVDPEASRAVVVDTSSNGTRVNGIRLERSVGVPLNGGDRLQVGSHVLEFRGETLVTRGSDRSTPSSTISIDTPTTMAMVVGDLINFSTVSEQADQKVLARDVDRLYRELRALLTHHRGTLVDYVGDAFFASWELEADVAAVDNALAFALNASRRVSELTPEFELRYADGTPLKMGWALTMGSVVMRLMPGSVVMALGDAVNVGFRISSIAGREGRPTILAVQAVREAAGEPFKFSEPETVPVKGRVGTETIYGVFTS